MSVMHDNTALLMIDLQVNQLDPAYYPVAGGDALIDRLNGLVSRARAAHIPVFWVRNCGGEGEPDVKGTPGWELHPRFAPAAGEPFLDKTTCNTFASTDLDAQLRSRKVGRVIVAGLQSDWCIRETTQGALDGKYKVTLVSDGHSTLDGKTRQAADISREVNDEFRGRVELCRAEEVSLVREIV
jgi:nicotinamidase-related amidase